MAKYQSQDGLMTSSDPEAVALWNKIAQEHANAKDDWTVRLRQAGVKLAHPDDGWVHELGRGNVSADDNRGCWLSLSWYPQFNDHPEKGDLIALGWPDSGYRLVRVTNAKIENTILGHFETYYYDLPPVGYLGREAPKVEKVGFSWKRLWYALTGRFL